MRFARTACLAAVAGIGATALTVVGIAAPAQAAVVDAGQACLTPDTNEAAAAARGGGSGLDHRGISAAEQRAITRQTNNQLAAKGVTAASGATALVARKVPVYVHVMRDRAGRGNVTNRQVARQVAVLNRDFSGLGYRFDLVRIDRFKNTAWHKDRRSGHYRAVTRKGGARALNIWLVDFAYLGIATFPWDYARRGAVDGIRVQYNSLPGGNIPHYSEGRTATHETGHWLGLFHTFQGGCTSLNDQVDDTPAQASPTSGCPAGRDSCPLDGTDPIHNYMDYSWDSCYSEFTQGQAARAHKMWTAYRA
ncbi:zinc metalloprotease [Nocardioides sp.]|uniref:zinc metalloprotease n=1 Tax=Nocardioides sp. TaxID=35761 RepID=UPI002D8084E2|nr:zinc metalloprotease [Nocardioides sp.]HET8961145.1 zinc metalloprotease [Nocardioides sp.]